MALNRSSAEGIQFKRHASRLAYGLPGNLAECVQMDVPRKEIDVAVTDPDEGPLDIAVAAEGARGLEQAAVRGALEPALDGVAWHRVGWLHRLGVLVNPRMRSRCFSCEVSWDRPVG